MTWRPPARVDVYATALFRHMTVEAIDELDLSYTPPLGAPWDAIQTAAQAWTRQHLPATGDINTSSRSR
jgi:hypothetical protein